MNPNSNYQQYPPQPYYYPPQNYLIHPDISNGSINQLSGLGKVGTTIGPKCNNDHPNYTKDRLPQGKRLDYDKWLVSQNQKFQAGIQEEGNLVIMSFDKYQPLWDAPHRIQLNSNGNLELQDYRNAKLRESDTLNQGKGPFFLIMQNNGNLALFDSKQNIIWSTNTVCYLPNSGQPKCNNNHANYSKDRLKQGSRLEQDKWLVSKNQKYYAGVQADGNLIVSPSQNYSPFCSIWSSKTKKKGDGSNYLSLEGSGILKVQDKRSAILWDSDTLNQGQGPYTLIMQNDGNLALIDRNESIIWCTCTSMQQ